MAMAMANSVAAASSAQSLHLDACAERATNARNACGDGPLGVIVEGIAPEPPGNAVAKGRLIGALVGAGSAHIHELDPRRFSRRCAALRSDEPKHECSEHHRRDRSLTQDGSLNSPVLPARRAAAAPRFFARAGKLGKMPQPAPPIVQ